jgi:hypothetical protein
LADDASVRAPDTRKIKKETGVFVGEKLDSGPFKFSFQPNPFAGERINQQFKLQ